MCDQCHQPDSKITSSGRSDLIAKRVTVSLATKSRTFRENTSQHIMDCLQAVRNANWDFSILPHHDLLAVEKALADHGDKVAGDYKMPRHDACKDLRKDSGTCELCGEQHVRFIFKLCDSSSGEKLFESVGSTCIFTFIWNALGVTSSEAARKILEGMKDKLIRIAMAEQFQADHPNFGEEIEAMHAEFMQLSRFRRSDRWVKSRANEIGRVAKYFRKNGMVTPLRYKQFTEVWPKELETLRGEVEEERKRNIEYARIKYSNLLRDFSGALLTYERDFLQRLADNPVLMDELTGAERRWFGHLSNRTYGSRVESPNLACDPTLDQIRTVVNAVKDRNDFTRSLHRQFTDDGWLSLPQLQSLFGCRNGRTMHGYEPLSTQYGVSYESPAQASSEVRQEA